MKKTFRIITTTYLLIFTVFAAYLAFTSFNGGYVSQEQNNIAIAGGILAIVLSVINTILSRKQ